MRDERSSSSRYVVSTPCQRSAVASGSTPAPAASVSPQVGGVTGAATHLHEFLTAFGPQHVDAPDQRVGPVRDGRDDSGQPGREIRTVSAGTACGAYRSRSRSPASSNAISESG